MVLEWWCWVDVREGVSGWCWSGCGGQEGEWVGGAGVDVVDKRVSGWVVLGWMWWTRE